MRLRQILSVLRSPKGSELIWPESNRLASVLETGPLPLAQTNAQPGSRPAGREYPRRLCLLGSLRLRIADAFLEHLSDVNDFSFRLCAFDLEPNPATVSLGHKQVA